jgi:hypothetical protein
LMRASVSVPSAAFYAGAVFRPHAAGLEPQPHLSAAEAWAEADRRRAGAKKGLRDADPCTGRRRDVSAEDNSSKAWEREFLRQNGGRPLPPSVSPAVLLCRCVAATRRRP